MKVKLEYEGVKRFAYIYLVIPVILFCAGYLRLSIAIPAVVVTIFSASCAIRRLPKAQILKRETICISIPEVLLIFLVMLLWSYLGGLNGLFYQTSDWPYRNAIFHDLIDYKWPVVYEETASALDYYVGFWLLPAILAKAIAFIVGDSTVAWLFGQMALWVWAALGLLTIALVLFTYVNATSFKKRVLTIAIFIGFSGLDILGAWLSKTLCVVLSPTTLHLEWWASGSYQFSSITTCLFWVFNQAIIPWLTVICFLSERDARNYVLLGVSCLTTGPFAFVGLVILMIAKWGYTLFKKQNKKVMRSGVSVVAGGAFSLSNILLSVSVIPIFILFYIANNSFAKQGTVMDAVPAITSGEMSSSPTFLRQIIEYLSPELLLFYVIEVGIYLLLVRRYYRKNVLFYAIAISSLVIPFIRIGESVDFCMRTSIPNVFVLMAFCSKYLVRAVDAFPFLPKRKKGKYIALVVTLMIGACTPIMEIYRGFYHVFSEKSIFLANDTIGSIASLGVTGNFSSSYYLEKPFFSYLAKPSNKVMVALKDHIYEKETILQGETEEVFHWCEKEAELSIFVDKDRLQNLSFRIVMALIEGANTPFKATISIDGQKYVYDIENRAQEVVIPLSLSRGAHSVTITTTREQERAPEDRRNLYFTISGIQLLDEKGGILWAESF